MQSGPYLLASRTPDHDAAGCGDCQRSSPTGGFANGTPLNAVTPSRVTPDSAPLSTRTVAFGAASAASTGQRGAERGSGECDERKARRARETTVIMIGPQVRRGA